MTAAATVCAGEGEVEPKGQRLRGGRWQPRPGRYDNVNGMDGRFPCGRCGTGWRTRPLARHCCESYPHPF